MGRAIWRPRYTHAVVVGNFGSNIPYSPSAEALEVREINKVAQLYIVCCVWS